MKPVIPTGVKEEKSLANVAGGSGCPDTPVGTAAGLRGSSGIENGAAGGVEPACVLEYAAGSHSRIERCRASISAVQTNLTASDRNLSSTSPSSVRVGSDVSLWPAAHEASGGGSKRLALGWFSGV